MKIKTKKRRDRAARRSGVCQHCATVEAFKLSVGAPRNTVSAPCARCARLLVMNLDALSNPENSALLRAFIRAASPDGDVCTEATYRTRAGEPLPDIEPHCARPHLCLIVETIPTAGHAPQSA